jgi:Tol biopolymer transport system component
VVIAMGRCGLAWRGSTTVRLAIFRFSVAVGVCAVLGVVVALPAAGVRSPSTERVSISPAGEPFMTPGNDLGVHRIVSNHGRLVAIDDNGTVYVRDRRAGVTFLAAVGFDGSPANGRTSDPSISGDGRWLAFASTATNLVPGGAGPVDPVRTQVFLRDLVTGRIRQVSLRPDGGQPNGGSFIPMISANGRYLLFWTDATDLAPGGNRAGPVLEDLRTHALRRVPYGTFSDDGRLFAFSSPAEADTAHVYDVVTGQDQIVSIDPNGQVVQGVTPAISANGRYVVFYSLFQANYVTFVRDLRTRTTVLASVWTDGSPISGDGEMGAPSISADGRTVSFTGGPRSDLCTGPFRGGRDVYVRDLHKAVTFIASQHTAGTCPDNVNDDFGQATFSDQSALSPDGRYVVFRSHATNIANGGGLPGIFITGPVP